MDRKSNLEQITFAEIHEIEQPIQLSIELKEKINAPFLLLISNKESRAIRLVPIDNKEIIKIVLILNPVDKFTKSILNFYRNHDLDIIYTSGICFRKGMENSDEYIYESYVNQKKFAENLSIPKLRQEISEIEGVIDLIIESVDTHELLQELS